MTETDARKIFAYRKIGNDISIYGYKGNSKIVSVPDNIGACSVTSIGRNYRSKYNFCNPEEVYLPKSVKDLMEGAFNGSYIKRLHSPGVNHIGHACFSNSLLEEIDYSNELSLIGSYAFETTNLKKIRIQTLGNYSFLNNSNLEEADIKGCKKIPIGCFAGCASLKRLYVNDDLELIKENAFRGCNAFMGILMFPKSIKAIYANAFQGTRLNKVLVPNSIESIHPKAFPESTNIIIY